MHIKLIISALTSAFILFLFPLSSAHAEEEECSFTYTVINDQATIIGYTGNPTYLEIPETIDGYPIVQLRDNAFFNCSSLKQISLPSTITEIGHHAFYSCSSLESIVLPQNLKSIGMGAFDGCRNLTAVNIPNSLNSLSESCFRRCTSLTEIVIPCGISEIGDFCFSGCESLSYVSIGSDTEAIGVGAFYMCESLESIYIPKSVTDIGYEAIGYTNDLSGSSVQNGFTVLGETKSAAESYAEENNIIFSPATEAIQSPFSSNSSMHRVPMWVILLLSVGGIGFFALSCIIAVRQHRHEEKIRTNLVDSECKKITVDNSRKL